MGKPVLPMRLSAGQLARIEAGRARREAPVEVVVSGSLLKPTQRIALAEAERLARGGQSERRKAAMLVRTVEAQLRVARDAASVEAGIADTLDRAAARGEAFEVEVVDVGQFRRDADGGLVRVKGQPVLDVQTVRRARRHDGIASLHRDGHISDDERRIADLYRAEVEASRPPVGVAAIEPRVGKSWSDPEAPMAAAMERGKALRGLAEWLFGARADGVDPAHCGNCRKIKAPCSQGLAADGRRCPAVEHACTTQEGAAVWDAVQRSSAWSGGGMTPRRIDRQSVRARLDHLPGWVVEALIDQFEPAALTAMAAAEKKRKPRSKPPSGGKRARRAQDQEADDD